MLVAIRLITVVDAKLANPSDLCSSPTIVLVPSTDNVLSSVVAPLPSRLLDIVTAPWNCDVLSATRLDSVVDASCTVLVAIRLFTVVDAKLAYPSDLCSSPTIVLVPSTDNVLSSVVAPLTSRLLDIVTAPWNCDVLSATRLDSVVDARCTVLVAIRLITVVDAKLANPSDLCSSPTIVLVPSTDNVLSSVVAPLTSRLLDIVTAPWNCDVLSATRLDSVVDASCTVLVAIRLITVVDAKLAYPSDLCSSPTIVLVPSTDNVLSSVVAPLTSSVLDIVTPAWN